MIFEGVVVVVLTIVVVVGCWNISFLEDWIVCEGIFEIAGKSLSSI